MALPGWFVFALFAAWGIGSACKAWARQKRYREYQHDPWLLTDAIEVGLMSFAFIGSALRQSPHPVLNFEGLSNWIILAWLIAFIPFAIGVFLDWRSIARIERKRGMARIQGERSQ